MATDVSVLSIRCLPSHHWTPPGYEAVSSTLDGQVRKGKENASQGYDEAARLSLDFTQNTRWDTGRVGGRRQLLVTAVCIDSSILPRDICLLLIQHHPKQRGGTGSLPLSSSQCTKSTLSHRAVLHRLRLSHDINSKSEVIKMKCILLLMGRT